MEALVLLIFIAVFAFYGWPTGLLVMFVWAQINLNPMPTFFAFVICGSILWWARRFR